MSFFTAFPGLFYLVDSECLMPSGTDASLFQKIQNNYRNSRATGFKSRKKRC